MKHNRVHIPYVLLCACAALLLYCATVLLMDASWLHATRGEVITFLFCRGDMLMPALLFVLFLFARISLVHIAFSRSDTILCGILSIIFLFGRFLTWAPNDNCIARLMHQPVPCLTAVAGFMLLLLILLYWGRLAITRLCVGSCSPADRFLRHPLRNTLLLLLLCWSPYIVTRWPGSIEFDAYNQILQMNGFATLTGASPVASTVFIGGLVRLGKTLFDTWDAGLIIAVLLQSCICALILSYSVAVMKKMAVPSFWCLTSAVLYGVCPVFPCCATTLIKDSLFSCVTVLFVVLLARFLLADNDVGTRQLPLLGGIAFLVCILRNNGVCYIAVPAVAILIRYLRKRERAFRGLLICFLAAIALYGGYCYALFNVLAIPQGSGGSALTIPFQQTARFVKYYPADVTEEEAQVIDAVLDFDQLGKLYKPEISDPVKATYHGDQKALIRYFGVWFRQFLKRPACYIQATLLNSYPYYYPGDGLTYFYAGRSHSAPFLFTNYPGLYPAAERLSTFVDRLDSSLLLPFCSIGFQTWMLLYLFAGTVSRRDSRYLFLLLPALTGVLICIGCPAYLNGNGMRYSAPHLFVIPFLMGLWLQRRCCANPVHATEYNNLETQTSANAF